MNKSNWEKSLRIASALALFVLAAGQAPAASAAERMTREKLLEYFERFNAEDERYGELLADDVVFPHPTAGTLRGRKEVVGHYKKFWDSGVRERREPDLIVIDNDGGWVAAQLTVRITAKPGITPKLPTGEEVKPGEEWVGNNVIFYQLRDGKISFIRGGKSSPIKLAGKP